MDTTYSSRRIGRPQERDLDRAHIIALKRQLDERDQIIRELNEALSHALDELARPQPRAA